jgi:hypothetical protein
MQFNRTCAEQMRRFAGRKRTDQRATAGGVGRRGHCALPGEYAVHICTRTSRLTRGPHPRNETFAHHRRLHETIHMRMTMYTARAMTEAWMLAALEETRASGPLTTSSFASRDVSAVVYASGKWRSAGPDRGACALWWICRRRSGPENRRFLLGLQLDDAKPPSERSVCEPECHRLRDVARDMKPKRDQRLCPERFRHSVCGRGSTR